MQETVTSGRVCYRFLGYDFVIDFWFGSMQSFDLSRSLVRAHVFDEACMKQHRGFCHLPRVLLLCPIFQPEIPAGSTDSVRTHSLRLGHSSIVYFQVIELALQH